MSVGRRRARAIAGALGTALVVAIGAAAAFGFGGSDTPPARPRTLPPATAKITRTTLTATETVHGTLGYGDVTVVSARSGGTVTWLPALGSQVTRGKPAYRADGKPVVLLYGGSPLYRELRPGRSGADVRLLERNLAALGYDGFTVDGTYTAATAHAVRAWQDDLSLDETGTVAPAQVVVAPGRMRVAGRQAALGDPAQGPIITCTGTTRLVSVDLDVTHRDLVRKGAAATIELPGDTRVRGKVSSVGAVAKAGKDDAPATIEVTLSVRDQKRLGGLDEAPVDVILAADSRKNVLTVPVNALAALPGGGYGVQVVEGAASRYVPVETGMFAGGRVEITGAGLAPGTSVGVPA